MRTDQKRTGSQPDEHAGSLWRNPLLHLSACLAIGVLVVLAILAINWLT